MQHLSGPATGEPVDYALTGANGGYARTLLSQTRLAPTVHPAVLCDLDVDGLVALCLDLGMTRDEFAVATSPEQVAAVTAERRTAIVGELPLIEHADYRVLVEATGSPAHGTRAAEAALLGGHHVVMVSKEVDSVAGPHLRRLAGRTGLVYTLAAGDQPANLLDLIDWARGIGLPVVAAGKSSEYDLVFDPAEGTVSQLDRRVAVDRDVFTALLALGEDVPATLAARAAAVAAFERTAAADYCEMAVVATNAGLVPDVERLHYPVARIAELADVYALREHGGILRGEGRIDVFSALRPVGEASFAGGVFVVVRTGDGPTWRTLAEKGHVVSRDGRYACIYRPYHLMGVETIATILAAAGHDRPAADRDGHAGVVLAGRAGTDLAVGHVLSMGGHHHEVAGIDPVVLPADRAPDDVAPLYLLAGATVRQPIAAGSLVTFDRLVGLDSHLLGVLEPSTPQRRLPTGSPQSPGR